MNSTENDQSAIERGLRVRRLRGLANLTRDELSEKAKQFGENLTSPTLRHWEEGRGGGLTRKGALKLIKVFAHLGVQTDLTWLEYGFGTPPTYIGTTPHPTHVQPIQVNNIITDIDTNIAIQREINLFLQSNPSAFITTILDDAMLPLFKVGDILGGYARQGKDIKQLLNEDCIVETEDHLIICRRLLPGKTEGHYILNCINPNTTAMPIYDVKLLRAAPIVWLRRREYIASN